MYLKRSMAVIDVITQALENHKIEEMQQREIAELVLDAIESNWMLVEETENFSDMEAIADSEAARYGEYNFLSSNYRELQQAIAFTQMELQKKEKQGDVMLLAALNRMEHDMGIISPLVRKQGLALTEFIEEKYEVKFKFLRAPVDKKDN